MLIEINDSNGEIEALFPDNVSVFHNCQLSIVN